MSARERTRSEVFVGMKATLSRLCMRESKQKRVRERNREQDSTASVCVLCVEKLCVCVSDLFSPTAKQPGAFSVWFVCDEVNQS